MRDKIDYDIQRSEWAGLCMFKLSKFGIKQFKLNNLESWEVCERQERSGWGAGGLAGDRIFAKGPSTSCFDRQEAKTFVE
jgi:hypothetical protein